MASRGHRVEFLEAGDSARVQIGDNYYGKDPTDKRLQVLTWLNPPSSGAPLAIHREPGTNLWFLNTRLFESWHDGEDRFMFVHGIVGCGKTTLLNSIAGECQRRQRPMEVVISFYFSSTMNQIADLNAFLRFLVAQLYQRHDARILLEDLYHRHNRSFPSMAPSDADLKELIAALLSRPSERAGGETGNDKPQNIFILVDGIDEIRDRSTRRGVTGYLNELCSLSSAQHRVLTTSRPEADVLAAFRADHGWRRLPIPKDSVRSDIELFVKHELERQPDLEDMDEGVRTKLLARLAGPEQTMFRWASLQLNRLLDSQLLLQPDVSDILISLPTSLNETYDRILAEILPRNQIYASTALRWLTTARQPLLIEELIDACSIDFADGGCPAVSRRLRPLDLLRLLPNLISIEPPITAGGPRQYELRTHYAALSHFSVKEYLLGHGMSSHLRQAFNMEPKSSHHFVASCCIAYLYWTNKDTHRSAFFPLREYAWNFWPAHCLYSGTVSVENVEQKAVELSETIASAELEGVISQLPRVLARPNILVALRQPLFAAEFKPASHPLGRMWYSILGPDEFRLLEICPSTHWYVPIRCRLSAFSLKDDVAFEAASFTWTHAYSNGIAFINGQQFLMKGNLSQLLRGLRRPNEVRKLWIDAICINQDDSTERVHQTRLMPQIYRKSHHCAVWVGKESDSDAWAIRIVENLDEILQFGQSEHYSKALAATITEGDGADPYVALRGLFERTWWGPRSAQEAIMAPRATILYGKLLLDFQILERIVRDLPQVRGILNDVIGLHADPTALWESREWQRAVRVVEAKQRFRDTGRFAPSPSPEPAQSTHGVTESP